MCVAIDGRLVLQTIQTMVHVCANEIKSEMNKVVFLLLLLYQLVIVILLHILFDWALRFSPISCMHSCIRIKIQRSHNYIGLAEFVCDVTQTLNTLCGKCKQTLEWTRNRTSVHTVWKQTNWKELIHCGGEMNSYLFARNVLALDHSCI